MQHRPLVQPGGCVFTPALMEGKYVSLICSPWTAKAGKGKSIIGLLKEEPY